MVTGNHHLQLGSYPSDVSGLSFLPSSPRPLLLAGIPLHLPHSHLPCSLSLTHAPLSYMDQIELLVYDVDSATVKPIYHETDFHG
jgi:hypothetical protein